MSSLIWRTHIRRLSVVQGTQDSVITRVLYLSSVARREHKDASDFEETLDNRLIPIINAKAKVSNSLRIWISSRESWLVEGFLLHESYRTLSFGRRLEAYLTEIDAFVGVLKLYIIARVPLSSKRSITTSI